LCRVRQPDTWVWRSRRTCSLCRLFKTDLRFVAGHAFGGLLHIRRGVNLRDFVRQNNDVLPVAETKRFKAIAAMSENRVIACGNKIPWHLPEDFKWFKSMTTGQVIVMGRKTFESIGKPLPNRATIVLSRRQVSIPGVQVVSDLSEIDVAGDPREIFICGGAQVYEQALPQCSDLYLTLVKRNVHGDVFFPPFEDQFQLVEQIIERDEFVIRHYRNKVKCL
jgi:dihydrofolate reductase